MNQATIIEHYNPDDFYDDEYRNQYYTWKIRLQNATIFSNMHYVSKNFCHKRLTDFAKKMNIKLKDKIKEEITSNYERMF